MRKNNVYWVTMLYHRKKKKMKKKNEVGGMKGKRKEAKKRERGWFLITLVVGCRSAMVFLPVSSF